MKYIKASGCHECEYIHRYNVGNIIYCYPLEQAKNGIHGQIVQKYIDTKTIHPDCPLDDLINPLDAMGAKVILFKMSQRVRSGQFDSRSFVGDIALELRALLFKDEKSFWKEYDEWEIKNK